jgi:hypothetical protein
MFDQFTLGIEEEFQIVDPETRELKSHVSEILEEGKLLLGEKIKPEMIQSMIEVGTGVCANIQEAREDITTLRCIISGLAKKKGNVDRRRLDASVLEVVRTGDLRRRPLQTPCRRTANGSSFAVDLRCTRARRHTRSRTPNTNNERRALFSAPHSGNDDLVALLAWF